MSNTAPTSTVEEILTDIVDFANIVRRDLKSYLLGYQQCLGFRPYAVHVISEPWYTETEDFILKLCSKYLEAGMSSYFVLGFLDAYRRFNPEGKAL